MTLMKKSVSLIHVSDLHLGRSFRRLGKKGALMRDSIRNALRRSVDLAVDRKADLFLIAGDVFDSPEPPGEAGKALSEALSRLCSAGIKTVLLPGTHDPARSRAFSLPLFADREDVTLLTPEAPAAVFDHLDAAVCAWFPSPERSQEWLGPPGGWDRGRTFKLGMAHGSAMDRFEPGEGPEDLIPEDILNSGVDYLALGHHHGMRKVERACMPAWYSGAPETLAADQKDAGHALHVLLEKDAETTVRVEPVKVGALSTKKITVHASELLAGRDIEGELESMADPRLFLDLVAEGAASMDAALPDWGELLERFGNSFFKLRIIDRTSRLASIEAMENVPENSVMAEFVRRMRDRMASAEGEERGELEEALRLGIHYLRGSDRDR